MKRFTVWVVAPGGDPAWQCLSEVAHGIRYALQELGYDVAFSVGDYPVHDADSRLIIFNAHTLPGDTVLPKDAIIYNAEQIQSKWAKLGTGEVGRNYIDRLRSHIVWDYSDANIVRLAEVQAPRTTLCRVGFYPQLSNIKPVIEDLDVLFVGSINDRRKEILYKLASHRINVRVLGGVFGEERNNWIARARIVLNIHYYTNPIFEIFRVSHLLANKKCVVTENGGSDLVLEDFAQRTCVYKPVEELAFACKRLLANEATRRQQAEKGYVAFASTDQVTEVKNALEKTL